MSWLLFWIVYIVLFVGAHYWIHRAHEKKTKEMFAAHDAAMAKIWANHQARMDALFAKYRK